MFYPNNIPNVKRVLRIVLGIGLTASALFIFVQPERGG
jgi:hypothetical protein